MKVKIPVIALVALLSCSFSSAQNIDIAKDFYSHNLKNKALEEFIVIYNGEDNSADERAQALFYMGQITFDLGRYTVALKDWAKLIVEFPDSQKAIETKERLNQLNEIFSKSDDDNISSSIAKSYLNNGDFWTDTDRKFSIDASWLPKVELAIEWYDRIIFEFPNTYAAELAYQRKLFTILGWKERGQYGSSYGIKDSYKKYMPQLLETFNSFESSFPESSFLQGFRYQIAQSYWSKKDWSNTKLWLNKIISESDGNPTFYSETAKARLKKVEY